MDTKKRDRFVSLWRKYFGSADLPFVEFYTDRCPLKAMTSPESERCIMSALSIVRAGTPLCLSAESRMCGGAMRYLGFNEDFHMPDLAYFLSYGIPGRMRGERYKKSPEIVRESERQTPPFRAPAPFLVLKRWDKLLKGDKPDVVVFVDGMDVISGLFTLANYDETDPNGVICPFGSGCSSIVYHPYMEIRSPHPRCVLGMFDISARPFVGNVSRASLSSAFQRILFEPQIPVSHFRVLSRQGRSTP
jgi:hypothetical protein